MRKKKQSKCLYRVTGLLLIFSLLLGICSVGAFAEASSGQSETATTPFTQGTLNSNSFRIPAMARLNDGTIVAAADARWNFTFDGGGGDIVTARSFDNGATWEDVQLANYMDDNGDVYNGSSTAFIDPSLVSNGETVYMLCDLYPYGVALNGNKETLPDYVTGFNEQGNLLLAENGTTDYCYYLREDGQICDENGNQVEQYNVDDWFRIYRNGEYISNLFYADSPFRVQRTNYLYLVSSDNGGESWSTPRLLTNVKDAGERACLVSPGRGIYKDGKIIYPIYSYSGSESGQYLGFIYSENQGESWERVDSCLSEWRSESTVVALGDGTLRFFYRNGTGYLKYVDYSFADNNWRDPVNTGIPVNSNTELSACVLTKTVNNHEVIAVTCPTGPNGNGSANSNGSYRSSGKLFLLQVNADDGQTLTKLSETALGPVATAQLSDPNYLAENGFFAYSCVLECDAGDLLVMYENNQYGWGAGSDKYYTITAKSVSANLTFDAGESETITDTATGVSITSEDGTTLMGVSVAPATVAGLSGTYIAYDIRLNAGRYTEAADVTLPLTEELKQAENLCGFVVNDDGSISKIDGTKSEDGNAFTFRAPHFSLIGVLNNGSETVNLKVGETKTLTDVSGVYTIGADSGLDSSIATVTAEAIPGAEGTYTKAAAITSGKKYLITTNGNNVISGEASTNGYNGSWSGASGLLMKSVTAIAAGNDLEQYLWTITATEGGYTVQNAAGKYLTVAGSNNSVTLSSTPVVLTVSNPATEAFAFANGSYFLNNFGGGNVFASSWEQTDPTNPGGNCRWTLYEYAPGAGSGTKLTFTGVKPGETSVEVGDTTYDINVAREEKKLMVSLGNAAYTITDEDAENASSSDSAVLTVTGTGNTLTLHPVAIGTAKVTTANAIYTIEVMDSVPVSDVIVGSADITGYHEKTVTCPVGGKVVTSIGMTVGQSYDLNTTLTEATWSSSDEGIFTVDENGLVTAVSIGRAALTVMGKTAEGNAAMETIPVVILAGPNTQTTRTVAMYIDEVLNSKIYLSINGSTNMIEILEGTLLYGAFDKSTGNTTDPTTTTAATFFAAPINEDYAVTMMSATDSQNNYYQLHDADRNMGDGATYYINSTATSGAGYWQARGLNDNATANWELVKPMVAAAIALGCDGGQGFTRRQAEGDLCEGLTFRSQRLPSVEKTIDSIYPKNGNALVPYEEGMTAQVGDKVYFNIAVTQYATTEAIVYTNASLTDNLADASFVHYDQQNGIVSDNRLTITPTLSDETLTEDITNNYTVEYVIKESDLDKTILNTVDLTFSYQSGYSQGTSAKASKAEAAISAVQLKPDDIVIDFGLPVTMDYTSNHGTYDLVSGAAQYGSVVVENNVVTYTPTTVLPDVDVVTLTNTAGGTATFKVYPATTVYYEEGFASYSGSWWENRWDPEQPQQYQSADVVGSQAIYGYDASYDSLSPSGGTEKVSGPDDTNEVLENADGNVGKGDTATLTFVGTGVELYTNNEPDTGVLLAIVTNESNIVERMLIVDTCMQTATDENGEDISTPATALQSGTAYNVPVVTLRDLTYGKHTLKVVHLAAYDNAAKEYVTKPIKLDGFRVFGTMDDPTASAPSVHETVYQQDLEDNPSFTELRDFVLTGLQLEKGEAIDQVYTQLDKISGATGSTCGAVVLSERPAEMTDAAYEEYKANMLKDLLVNGPKNEIYLAPGQSITFGITTRRTVQVGLKALSGEVDVKLNGEPCEVKSSTDMFYPVLAATDTETERTVTITNSSDEGGDLLSITLLKVCDDPSAALAPVKDIDFTQALIDLGLIEAPAEEEPAVPVNPFEDIREGAYYYGPVLWAVENAITAGKDATHFAPADSCTRAQAVTFLYRAAGEPAPTITSCDFADVSANAYYYKAVLWAVENGITAGVDATHFDPNATCTRAQIVTFLYRAAGQPAVAAADTAFTDVPANAYYRNAVLWTAENGITAGKDAAHFAPADTCTRAQIVTFLYRTEN